MKKWTRRVVLGTIALALYLNFGWMFGTWYYNNVEFKDNHSFVEQMFAGPGDFFIDTERDPDEITDSEAFYQLSNSFIWPLFAIITPAIGWFIYGVYKLLWLIFAGGIAKLLGVG